MGAGVAHRVHGIQVRQIVALLPGVKGKFQHLHAGIAGVLLQFPHLRGDVTQIFGDEIQSRQSFPDGVDEGHSRPGAPVAILCGFVLGRDGPVAFQPPEMVNPHHIIHGGGSGQPPNPPAVAGFFVDGPVVQGIAPQLPVGGEGVRGTAGNRSGTKAAVQLEQMGIGPNIRRVQRHIDGNVPDNANALFVGIAPQCLPLAEELVLEEPVKIQVFSQLLPLLLQSLRTAGFEALRPGKPGGAPQSILDSHKQGVVVEPKGIFPAESVIFLPGDKSFMGGAKNWIPPGVLEPKVHPVGGGLPGELFQLLLPQQSLLCQNIQINEVGISCPGGEGLIGGVSVACGIQGKNLPAGLPGTLEKVHEFVGVFSHGAHTVGAGQGGDMH